VTDSDEKLLLATILKQTKDLAQRLQSLQTDIAAIKQVLPQPASEWAVGATALAEALSGLNIKPDRILRLVKNQYFTTDEITNIGTEKQPRWKFQIANTRSAIERFERLPIPEQRRFLR
jgi:hypothetical protein